MAFSPCDTEQVWTRQELRESSPALQVFEKEIECLAYLAEARELVSQITALNHAQALALLRQRGNTQGRRQLMTLVELHDWLRLHPEEEDEYALQRLAELRKLVDNEIYHTRELTKEIAKLDKRIYLLIRHKDDGTKAKPKKPKRSKGQRRPMLADLLRDREKRELYQDLFYLLQTEPHKYLAKLLPVLPSELQKRLLTICVQTLYGREHARREEYLLLQLFGAVVERELGSLPTLGELLQGDALAARLLSHYKGRREAVEYLRHTLGPIVREIAGLPAAPRLELMPLVVYQQWRNAHSATAVTLSEEAALALPHIRHELETRVAWLIEMGQRIVQAVLASLGALPYGVRWLCRLVMDAASRTGRVPVATSPDDRLRLVGYFVFYWFLNPALVAPDAPSLGITDSALRPDTRQALDAISRVLLTVFHLGELPLLPGDHWVRLHRWIASTHHAVRNYLRELVDVDALDQRLHMSRFHDLVLRSPPTLLITMSDIAVVHSVLHEYQECLFAPNGDGAASSAERDLLLTTLQQLGPPPMAVDEQDDRQVMLLLSHRLSAGLPLAAASRDSAANSPTLVHKKMEAAEMKAAAKTFMAILRKLPIVMRGVVSPKVEELLDTAVQYAHVVGDTALKAAVDSLNNRLGALDRFGHVPKVDRYRNLLQVVTAEVAERQDRRQQCEAELAELTHALEDLRQHRMFLEDRETRYQEYLDQIREHPLSLKKELKQKQHARRLAAKLGADSTDPAQSTGGDAVKIIKFPLADLIKKGVIAVQDNGPKSKLPSWVRRTTVELAQDEHRPSKIFLKAQEDGATSDTVELELDFLLEQMTINVEAIALPAVPSAEAGKLVLKVQRTLRLLNKMFF